MKQKEMNALFECLNIAEECSGDINMARRLIGLTLGIKPSAAAANGDEEGQGGVDDDPLTDRQKEALETLNQLKEDDGDLTVKGVAEAMETTEANASVLLAGLMAKGHVTRAKEGSAFVYTPKAA